MHRHPFTRRAAAITLAGLCATALAPSVQAADQWPTRPLTIVALLMVFVGALIGVVVILMYLPIFELAGSMR